MSSKKDEWFQGGRRGGAPGRSRSCCCARSSSCRLDESRDPHGAAGGRRRAAPHGVRAAARAALKKGMWGPVKVNGASQFPVYRELGATVYNTTLSWRDVAVRRPTNPRDPRDPAYQWPAGISDAIEQAGAYRIQLAILVMGTPAWANGPASELVPIESRRLRRFPHGCRPALPQRALLDRLGRTYPCRKLLPNPVEDQSERGAVAGGDTNRSFLRADPGRFICGLEGCFQTQDRHRRELVHRRRHLAVELDPLPAAS